MSFGFHSRVTATPDSLIEYFQEHGVLRPRTNPYPCPVVPCGKDMAWTAMKPSDCWLMKLPLAWLIFGWRTWWTTWTWSWSRTLTIIWIYLNVQLTNSIYLHQNEYCLITVIKENTLQSSWCVEGGEEHPEHWDFGVTCKLILGLFSLILSGAKIIFKWLEKN